MCWSAVPGGGFTAPGVEPWLPLSDKLDTRNVDAQLGEPGSMLNMYRRLLRLRRESAALRVGSFLTHPSSTDEVLVYRRESDDETMTVALNLSDSPKEVAIRSGRVVFSTLDPTRTDPFRRTLELAPTEGAIVSHQ